MEKSRSEKLNFTPVAGLRQAACGIAHRDFQSIGAQGAPYIFELLISQ
jgi:hypothetical protein